MPLTVGFAHMVIFDSALAFFVTLALIAFYFGIEGLRAKGEGAKGEEAVSLRPSSFALRPSKSPYTIARLAIGLGVITKGPVAIALPLLVAIPYAIKRRRVGALWSWGGLVAFVAVIAPWVWGVTKVVPDFLHYVLVTETAQRLATKALKRTGPPGDFIPFVLGGPLPCAILAITYGLTP